MVPSAYRSVLIEPSGRDLKGARMIIDRVDRAVTCTRAQRLSLLALRVSTGFLLIWFGLDKVVNARPPLLMRRNVELDQAASDLIGLGTGGVEVFVGLLCVVGLWRSVALPLQAAINGVTAVSVWWAILDPFGWYITGVDRIVFNSHVFYPTIITFSACVLLVVFRHQDTWALDQMRRRRTRPA
jgi:putative oxidoreductase